MKLPISCSEKIDGVPHYDVEISEEGDDSIEKILIKNIKPQWNDDDYLKRWVMSGGFMNKTIAYGYIAKQLRRRGEFEQKSSIEKIVIRIQRGSTEIAKERSLRELRNIEELAAQAIIPHLYCTFDNGYVCKFVEGKVCKPSDFTNKHMLCHSAICTAKLHSLKISENYLINYEMRTTVYETMSKWLDSIPLPCDANNNNRVKYGVPSTDELRAEAALMQDIISKIENLAITYCHNDLHSSNLILDPSETHLQCIDHEFGGPNYSAFDIANHFNEFCGVHNFNYKLFPSRDTQLWWLRLYLKELGNLMGTDTEVREEEVDNHYNVVQIMSLLSNLFWTIWAFVPENHADTTFDYVGYGIARLNAYYINKEKILNGLVV